MKMKLNFAVFLVLFSLFAAGQMSQFHYQRALKGTGATWHTLTLPNEVYHKINPDLTDVRVFGITARKDTVEAAFVWKQNNRQNIKKEVAVSILNTATKDSGTFYTLEISRNQILDEITLDFINQNFDWNVNLEGSNDEAAWFTVLQNYRILSISSKDSAPFKFTTLKFPASRYKFYRVFIPSKDKTALHSAKVFLNETGEGILQDFRVKSQKIFQIKKTQQTIIEIGLEEAVPVSLITINTADSFDFYRPVTIEYVSDSLKMAKGYTFEYQKAGSGILNSLDLKAFKTETATAKKFRITIDNGNNPVLKIGFVKMSGFKDQMVIRFLEDAQYFLVYGNKNVGPAQFDLTYFKDKIPVSSPELSLGKEEVIHKKGEKMQQPLFQNKIWLWIVIILVMLLLGGFTLRMMSNEN